MRLFHGCANADWAPHVGACLTPQGRAAYDYANRASWRSEPFVFEAFLELEGLNVEHLGAEASDRDGGFWAGDSDLELAAFAARGIDVIVYDDETEMATQHRTYRLCTARAVAACERGEDVFEEVEP